MIDWSVIWTNYYDAVFKYIRRRVSDSQLAEDLVGQTFLKAIEAHRMGNGPRLDFSSWFLRIAHNLVITEYRRRAVRISVSLEDVEDTLCHDGSMMDVVASDETRQELHCAIQRLSRKQREVVTHHYGGLQLIEISRRTGQSEYAVKALHNRALRKLRRILEEK